MGGAGAAEGASDGRARGEGASWPRGLGLSVGRGDQNQQDEDEVALTMDTSRVVIVGAWPSSWPMSACNLGSCGDDVGWMGDRYVGRRDEAEGELNEGGVLAAVTVD